MKKANLTLMKNTDAGHTNLGMLNKVFEFGEVEIRMELDENGESWFVASDICKALKLKNTSDALVKHVYSEDIAQNYTLTKGGKQKVNFVNEQGMYGLIFGSEKKSAKDFKKFVCKEILPSIRKQGMFLSEEKQRQLDDLKNSYDLLHKEFLRLKSEFGVWSKEVKDYLRSVKVKCRDLDPVNGKAHTYCGVKKIRSSQMTPREKDAWNIQQMSRSSHGQLNKILKVFVNNKCYKPEIYQTVAEAVKATNKLKDLLTFDNLVQKTIEIRDHSEAIRIKSPLTELERNMTQGELFAGDLQYFN
jgi:prophage antirepressor-like protein